MKKWAYILSQITYLGFTIYLCVIHFSLSPILMMLVPALVTTLAHFKSFKWIYLLRGGLFTAMLVICISEIPSFAFELSDLTNAFILLIPFILSFFEKEEIEIKELTEEEQKQEKVREYDHKRDNIIITIVACLTTPFIILVATVLLTLFLFAPVSQDRLKDEFIMRYSMTTAEPTKEQQEQFTKDFGSYASLRDNWYYISPKENDTAMFEDLSVGNDYWLLNNNMDFILETYYDSFDGATDENILVKNTFKYPNTESSKIEKIALGGELAFDDYSPWEQIIPQLTNEQFEILRDLANHKHESLATNSEKVVDRYDLIWYFEECENLVFCRSQIYQSENGNFYLVPEGCNCRIELPNDIEQAFTEAISKE